MVNKEVQYRFAYKNFIDTHQIESRIGMMAGIDLPLDAKHVCKLCATKIGGRNQLVPV